MNLSKLNFGAPAAERDINQGLKEYFVESDVFKKFFTKKKYVLIGNRGTGKSAIFKIIADRHKSKGELVIELSPENYSYEMLSQLMLKESAGSWAKQGAYAAAWKYLLYVLVMKELNKAGRSFKTGSAVKIYNYLRDNHKDEQPNPIAILVSYLKRLEGVKLGKFEASFKTQELTRLYKLEEIMPLLPDLYGLCKKMNVTILIDELDKGWDASEDAKAFISGLFQASMAMNEDTEYIRVMISLRKELYDSIPALYEDAQKYRDIMDTIEWNEASLLNLISNRIRYSVSDLSEHSDIDSWNSIFVDTLDYRQTKSFNYIIDRTLYRPREIIQFCSDIIESKTDVTDYPLDYSIISKTELKYSQSRTQDIAAEYRFQWPGLNSVFELFRGKSYSFDRNELELFCMSMSTGEIRVGAEASWVLDQEPDFLVDVLWNVGFLRAQAVGGVKASRRSGSSYMGPHQVANLNLKNINRFHVHPMFRAYLGLKESRDKND
ncbi:MAG TPA: hypothetical protein PLZ78_15535 [Spirochaetota bacterium]|nr:hypothetical protein [Spirochaetota bacterium]